MTNAGFVTSWRCCVDPGFRHKEVGFHGNPHQGKMTNIDFAHINLEYLLQARDLARQDTHAAGLVLGVSEPLAGQFADMTPACLVKIKDFQPPLVAPRLDLWWWKRLLRALADGEAGELQVVLEHAGMVGGLGDASEDGRHS